MSKEAMKLALEALENAQANFGEWWPEAIAALREAQAEQPAQQEPVACLVETEQGVMLWPIDDVNEAETYCEENEFPVLLYTSPPAQRTWVGLTEEEVDDLSREMVKGNKSVNWLAHAIEAKLKEKNA